MNDTEKMLADLNRLYPTSEITLLANAGKYAEAAETAANCAMWGTWPPLRDLAGLPSDYDTKKQWCAAKKAARFARFAKVA